MQYTQLGKTGLKVSKICLGMMSFGDPSVSKWVLDLDSSQPIIQKALDLGINFFDTANVYSRGRSEEITGIVLKDYRDEIVIATKVFFPLSGFGIDPLPTPNTHGLSRYHIKRAIEDSLQRLNMDYVDLYQIHRLDHSVPLDEILRSLNQLIDNGKVLHIGASSMFAWQFTKSLWMAERFGLEPFRTMQNHYNLCYREEEREMMPLCKDQCIGVIPWSPLARGFLTGKYTRDGEADSKRAQSDRFVKSRYFNPENFDVVERVVEIAKEKEVTPAQIALAWLFSKDYVTSPILGVTKIEHVEQAVEALEIKLTEDDIRRLEELYQPHPILGHS
ncbi:MAG: aldo/keto reductase [Candidatus Hodarchaeales archaeon]|jgi:aryl-alcohol dehydrogenase (NADP+)